MHAGGESLSITELIAFKKTEIISRPEQASEEISGRLRVLCGPASSHKRNKNCVLQGMPRLASMHASHRNAGVGMK
jgi:hypothetical protein